MKVEILTSYFKPYVGGIETVVLNLAEGLGKRGHDVYIHTAKNTPGPKNLKDYEKTQYYTIRRYPIYKYSLIIPKFFHKDSVLSLHNYSCLMNDYVALRFPARKKVLSAYGNITYERSQRAYQKLSILYDATIGRITLYLVNKIIAMTKLEKKGIIKKFPNFKNKVDIVAAGIYFTYKNEKFKKPFNFPYFVSCGRIAPAKHFDIILRIMKRFPRYHFVLAGRDIGHAKFLLNLAKELGVENRFHYMGEVTEKRKAELLSGGSVFITPDSGNAFGIANLEGFYYTGRVVAADSGGVAELTKEFDGETFPIDDLNGLERALKKSLKKSMTLNIKNKLRKEIEKKYSWDAVVDAYEKVLLSL